jgi:hypothetical protein
MVRDQALAAAGLLVDRVGGPSARPWQPPGLWEEAGATGSYAPDHGEGAHRRSLYTFRKRTAPPPNLLLFDAGSREQCQARRSLTTTPLQALVLLNDPVFVEAARALAARCREAEDAVGAAFGLLCSRAPISAERAALDALIVRETERFRAEPARAVELLHAPLFAEAKVESTTQETEPPLPVEELARRAALVLACQALLASDAAVMVR